MDDGDGSDDGMDDGASDGDASEDEHEHELDILDLQRQAAREMQGIQSVMLQNRLAAARKLVAAHEAGLQA